MFDLKDQRYKIYSFLDKRKRALDITMAEHKAWHREGNVVGRSYCSYATAKQKVKRLMKLDSGGITKNSFPYEQIVC